MAGVGTLTSAFLNCTYQHISWLERVWRRRLGKGVGEFP